MGEATGLLNCSGESESPISIAWVDGGWGQHVDRRLDIKIDICGRSVCLHVDRRLDIKIDMCGRTVWLQELLSTN
jgi:hypothetical protein